MKKVTPEVFMQHADQEELYKRTVVTKVELNNAKDESRILKTKVAS